MHPAAQLPMRACMRGNIPDAASCPAGCVCVLRMQACMFMSGMHTCTYGCMQGPKIQSLHACMDGCMDAFMREHAFSALSRGGHLGWRASS
eukprot:366047-Chlamydomonas_euryale.AAC.5